MNSIERRRMLYHLKLSIGIAVVILSLYGLITRLFFSKTSNDGSYTLTPLPDLSSFNYLLSLNLMVSLEEKTIEETYLNFQLQSKTPTPYYPQFIPSIYAIRIDGLPYEINYHLIDSDKPSSNLLYTTRTIPYVEHISKKLTRPNITIPLLPIPHGQIFEYNYERKFTFAVRYLNITDLYIASLNNRKLLRLRYEPLGLDQMQHQRWLFFSDADTQQLLAITNIQPHVIVSVDVQSGIVQEYARSSQPQLFSLLKGEQVFMGAAPVRLPNLDLYLGVFHTSSRTNLFYTFSTKYPYEIKCVLLESPLKEKISRRPITEIRMNGDSIFTLEAGIIKLSELFNDMQTQCTQKIAGSSSTLVQWFPSVLPSSIDMPPFIFNPAVLALPTGSIYPYLSVGRSSHDAEEHRIVHPLYHKQFSSGYWGIILGCFMDKDFTCAHIPRELHLFYPIKGIAQRYNLSSAFPHNFAGAEDPRLIWSETNAPLLVYGMNALENKGKSLTTRLVWMIDIRHVFKQLNFILPEYYSQISFYTSDQGVELNYRATLWEKNWMAFIHQSRMLIGYSVEPKITIQRRENPFIGDDKRWFFDPIATSQQAIQSLYPESKYDNILQTNMNKERIAIDLMHQGPNALLIVTGHSTFYFTIIHQRVTLYDRSKGYDKGFIIKHYMHYTALFDTQTPYGWLSMSRQQIDPILSDQSAVSERDRKFIFVTTLAFADHRDIKNGYGTLDSRIIVSYGLIDCLSYVWIGPLSELMNNMRKLF